MLYGTSAATAMPRYTPVWVDPTVSSHVTTGSGVGAGSVGSFGVNVGIGTELGWSGVASGGICMQPAEITASRATARKSRIRFLCRCLKVGPV